MPITFSSVIEAALLVIAISTDTFVASLAYGSNKIKIPFISVLIINIICTTILTVSLFMGSIIGPLISPQITTAVCFSILLLLGVIKILDSSIKNLIRKHNGINKQIKFSMFDLRLILDIYADPQDADRDKSRVLSPLEAVSLAIALSIDGFAVGFGAGLVRFNLIEVIILSLAFGIVSIMAGSRIGNGIAKKLSINISWVSGVLLIALGVLKLI